jgi:hypothetical protein
MTIPRWLALIPAMLITTSCAVSYTDSQGNKHLLGLGHVNLGQVQDKEVIAGEEIILENLGVLLSKNPLNFGISLGYNKESITILKNDVSTFPTID